MKRHWKFDIQISTDGVHFTDVLTGMSSSAATLNPETFELPDGITARYVRYVGHGVTDIEANNYKWIGYYNSLTQSLLLMSREKGLVSHRFDLSSLCGGEPQRLRLKPWFAN